MTGTAGGAPARIASGLDGLVQRAARVPRPASALGIAALLALVWASVWFSGGTEQATPHLFYVPIILAAAAFGLVGAFTTALTATVLAGPLMPLVVSTGERQEPLSWLVRGLMFVLVACLAALALRMRERAYEARLSTDLRRTFHPPDAGPPPDDYLLEHVDDVIDRRLFYPLYQPIYALDDGRLVAVEALTRFDSEPPEPPDRWFAAAHHTGRGSELEILAIESALDGARMLEPHIEVSVNASPVTVADPGLHELLARTERTVVVEITEHAVIEDYPLLIGSLDALRAAGAKIAVDDAGAGFASLRHIVQLAPDTIKLDMSLTQDLTTSPLRRALARALIDFAQETGAELVVEGMEGLADLGAWTGLGAYAAQGFLVGRPAPLPPPPFNPLIRGLPRRA